MPAALVLTNESIDDLDAFATALEAVGLKAWHSTLGAARTFQGRIERAGGWERVNLHTQLEWMRRARPFVAWQMVTGRLTATAEFLAFADLRIGLTARRHLPDVHEWFVSATRRLDATAQDTALQWNAVCKIAAMSGCRPDHVDTDAFVAARARIAEACKRRGRPEAGRNVRATFHRLQLTLFHAGKIDSLARPASKPSVTVSGWDPIPQLYRDNAHRYIPLHPELKTPLDDWIDNHRPSGLRSDRLLLERGRPIAKLRVANALARIANDADIGHVTPHQLRHTLATQAINRGMSLEAIAALLGHKTLAMTMVYARIADKTVADEYFAVTDKVEALYDQPHQLPASDEGNEMRKLRAEMHRRMLGNGYCARPVEMDCHFESICESCNFFVTTIEFKPTLRRQRDDAADMGQTGRQKIFDGLLDRLDEEAS